MNGHNRSLALTLISWCAMVLPTERASWAAAMKAEVEAIEDEGAALSFAAGCVWGSIKEATFTTAFAVRSVRFVTISGMLSLSLLAALITVRMINDHPSTALVFGVISALFAATAVWSYLRGAMALVRAASSMIPVYIIAYAFVSPEKGMAGEWVDARLYQALAIEGVAIWATLLTGAIFMLRIENLSATTHRELNR